MRHVVRHLAPVLSLATGVILSGSPTFAQAQAEKKPPVDAVQEAQTPRAVERTRPEQQLTQHDKSDIFLPANSPDSSPALKQQPEEGQMKGFDFARDPLDAKRPMQPAEEIVGE